MWNPICLINVDGDYLLFKTCYGTHHLISLQYRYNMRLVHNYKARASTIKHLRRLLKIKYPYVFFKFI